MRHLAKTQQVIDSGIDAGLHFGAQVSVWQAGQMLCDAAFGTVGPRIADGVEVEPDRLTSDHLMLWMSAGKPILVVGLARQVDAGVLDWDDPIAEWVPGFAQRGKDAVTLRHVLTHTGGFRAVVSRYPRQSWEETIEAVCASRLETGWIPGETAGYHPHSGWSILGRVLEVCTDEPLSPHLREAVLRPWKLRDTWVGMPQEAFVDHRGRLVELFDTSGGTPRPTGSEQEAWVTGQRPGGNVWGPARELARFYQGLLNGGQIDGVRLIESETATLISQRHRRNTMDRTFRAQMDWGLGLMVNNRRHDEANQERHGDTGTPYGFGPFASDMAFGHGGNQCSVGFADPEHEVSIAVIFNGQPGEARHQKRMRDVLAAIYGDLELPSS